MFSLKFLPLLCGTVPFLRYSSISCIILTISVIIKLIPYTTTYHHINNYNLENVDCSIE